MLNTCFGVLLAAIGAVGPAMGQSHFNHENEALLGVVAIEAADEGEKQLQVLVAHVLADSPAAAAGIQAADELVRIGKTKIKSAPDVDTALRGSEAGDKVEVELRRGKKEHKVVATLVARASYKGKFLARRERGTVGFKAPDWYVYAWNNVAPKTEPPTLTNTRGKVVVFHAFQSW